MVNRSRRLRRQSDRPTASRQQLQELAVEAAIWGMPIVSMDAMRQAYLRDARARYDDVVYWSRPADWKLQIATPNGSTRYVYVNFNTRFEPIVLEIPPAIGAGLFGSILDAWQVPAIDVGPEGADQGRGAKYLLLPPRYLGELPIGYVPIHLPTYNAYAVLRAIPEGSSEADIERALALIKRVRIYPLSRSRHPPVQRFVDMAGKLFDGIVRFDAGVYASLAQMLREEPPQPRDAEMMKRIVMLGLEPGRPFAPDRVMQDIFEAAAHDAHAYFMAKASDEGEPFWPDRVWRVPSSVGARTGFTFVHDGVLDFRERGLMYFLGCAPPARLGKASAYLVAFVDDDGAPLLGESAYTLHVPAAVPARQFWAITIYAADTAGFLRDSPRLEINSYDRGVEKNADGSVDVYFGPSAPIGHETNWVPTKPGRHWFTLFRFYGPEPALLEKTWKLPNIVKRS